MESSLRARIAALVDAEPALADEFRLRGALIEIVDHADLTAPELRLPGEYVRARLTAGTPLLDGVDLAVPATAGDLLERLTVAMLADPTARDGAEAMLTAVRGHRLHAQQLVGEAVVSHREHLAALAEAANVSAPLLETLADLTSRPLLASVAQRLRPALGLAAWDRGWCPICGARPMFAEGPGDLTPPASLSGPESGERVSLRCGRCTTAWAWSLPRCPDCPSGQLTTLDVQGIDVPGIEGAGAWTVLGCNACQSYLKLADSSRAEGLGQLLLDDLATWGLDRAALTAGYRRQSEPARRLEHGDPGGEDDADD